MDWQLRLIHVYCEICAQYSQRLWMHCERFSNNAVPQFSDEEVMTVYLFGIMRHKRTIQDIYDYTRDHLLDWFPALPSYGGFVQRLNKLSSVFPALLEGLHDQWPTVRGWLPTLLLDSMPVVLAKGKRRYKAKVASEVANCGYCASKDMKYYGVKLHVLGLRQAGTLPCPEYMELTPAGPHDLTVLDAISPFLGPGELYADKAYIAEAIHHYLAQQGMDLHTPVKKAKGQEELFLFEKLLSSSVSRVRQPIESFFNWIEEHTGIQIASKVRSLNGLLVHVFGRLAAAMLLFILNS